MPQWGKIDGVALTGTVVLTNNSVTMTGNTGTTFNTELRVGDNIFISTANTAAAANTRYRVQAVTNSTSVTLNRTYNGTTNTAATVWKQQIPRTTTNTKVGMRNIDVVGVDVTEAQVTANRAKGFKTPGWVRVNNTSGRNRVETLVAMRSMTQAVANDAPDDVTLADS